MTKELDQQIKHKPLPSLFGDVIREAAEQELQSNEHALFSVDPTTTPHQQLLAELLQLSIASNGIKQPNQLGVEKTGVPSLFRIINGDKITSIYENEQNPQKRSKLIRTYLERQGQASLKEEMDGVIITHTIHLISAGIDSKDFPETPQKSVAHIFHGELKNILDKKSLPTVWIGTIGDHQEIAQLLPPADTNTLSIREGVLNIAPANPPQGYQLYE